MKRQNKEKKEITIRQSIAKFKHQLDRKGKPYNRFKYINIDQRSHKRKNQQIHIEVPPTLCLKKQYDDSVNFIRKVRSESMHSSVQICLHFENCQKITPPAMLLLLAEVHRSRLLRGVNSITGTYPTDKALLRRMCHTGFFDLLGIKSPIKSEKTFPMEYIKFKSGTKLDASSAKRLREGLLGESIKLRIRPKNQLQRGVTEAMLNALQHAHPIEEPRRLAAAKHRWWLTGHYHKPSGNLSIMFCDLGVGIPTTLPRKHPIEYIRQLASILPGVKPDDGAMIYAGMKVGRTSTNKTHRGKGLNDLRQFIDQAGSGELSIYSKSGEYTYRSADSETHHTNSVAIQGTLIVWTVPIKSVADGLNIGSGDLDDHIKDINPIL